MPKLYFRVASDWEEVEKLRKQIDKLKAELRGMNSSENPTAFRNLNTRLEESSRRMNELVSNAARAGSAMDGGFKKKIYEASQVVNSLSASITQQRGVIFGLKNELAGLKNKLKDALSEGKDVTGLREQIKSLTDRIAEQKNVLFGLTQQQASARLAVRVLRDEQRLYNDEGERTNVVNNGLSVSWKKILGVIGGAAAMKAFANELVNVRGQFQQLEIAFGTMLKNKEKADALMSELVDIAAKTPFDLQGVASSAKQMLAYGSSAEKVGDELVMLGNVAAGVGSQLSEIAYLYGTLRTQGRAYAVDIRQFAGRGIPIYEELAKVLGVTKDKVNELVTAGKVGFSEVEKAFQNMTSSSGIYYNLMEEQSKSLTGQISNLGDAWDSMLNEIGKETQGAASMAISAAKGLIENYETVGKVIAGLIASYGAYRTAIILNTIAASKHTAAEIALINVRVLARKAQMALNAAMLTNPYIALATVIAGLVATTWALSDSTTSAERAADSFNKKMEDFNNKEADRKKTLESLVDTINSEVAAEIDRIDAMKQMQKEYPGVLQNFVDEEGRIKDLTGFWKAYNEEVAKSRTGNKQKVVEDLEMKLSGAEWAYNQAKKEGNRSEMKNQKQRIEDIKNELSQARAEVLKEVNKELSKDDNKKEESIYKEDVKKAKKEWDEKKKAYEDILKDEKATTEKVKKAREDMKSAEKAYNDLVGEKTPSSAAKKPVLSTEKDMLALKKKNIQDEINLMNEGREKKLAAIKSEYEARKEAIRENEKNIVSANKEAQTKGLNKNGLTSEQQSEIDKANRLNAQLRKKAEEDVYRSEIEAMRDYLAEYGTYQERKLAITQEYEQRIAEAATEGERKSLQEELKKNIADLDVEELKKELDWESVFGDLDKVSTESLQTLRIRLKEYISTQKNLQPDSLKDLVRAINSIDEKLNERNPFAALKSSITKLQSTTQDAKDAQEAYNKAVKEGTEAEQKNAKATLNAARNAKQKALAETTDSLHKSVGQVKEYVGAAEDLLGLVGQFGIDPPKWMGEWLEGMGQTLDGLESIDLTRPMSIITGGIKALSGAVNQVFSLGGVINWSGSNAKEVQDAINRLTDRNETLQTAIEDLTDEMRDSKGTKSVEAYQEAKKLQEEQNRNYLEIAKQQARYSGSHHSWNYYMKWNDEMIRRAREATGKEDFSGTSSLWELTPEQMKKLREDVWLWEKIQKTGKGNYGGRLTEKLDAYIDQAGKLEELTDQLYEGLTGISFDGMYDSFVDKLMDMKYSAKDAADDMSEYFMKAMLSNKIGEMYSDKLKEWWNKFGKAMEDDGTLDKDERESLMKEYMEYVDEAIKIRDELASVTGYDKIAEGSTQDSTKRGFGSELTHEDAGELSGRFTAVQIATEGTREQSVEQTRVLNILSVKMDSILSAGTEIRNIADDTRTIIANSYLELVQISENTGAIVKPIQQIQKDIEEVKKNTSRL